MTDEIPEFDASDAAEATSKLIGRIISAIEPFEGVPRERACAVLAIAALALRQHDLAETLSREARWASQKARSNKVATARDDDE